MKVLSGLVLDRYTHERVKKRILQCLKSWVDEFHGKPYLGLVEETVEELKEKGHQYEEESTSGTHPPDEILKREEEDLQRALAESEREAEWMNMAGVGNFPTSTLNLEPSRDQSSGYISSTSQAQLGTLPSNNPMFGRHESTPHPYNHLSNPQSMTGTHQALTDAMAQVSLQDAPTVDDNIPLGPATDVHSARTRSKPAPRRVKAMYDFEPNEEGELPFKEGDIIRVIDSVYKDWWKGELRGHVGIFPVNYVEAIPDPSPETLAKEAEMEAAVFAQAFEIDQLLQMMKSLDAKRDNLADNDELSELYQRTLSLRPKIVRLIEKYTQKKAELLQINSKFMTAKTTYDAMIEESLTLHHPGVAAETFTQPNPNLNSSNLYSSQSSYSQGTYGYAAAPYPAQLPSTAPYQRPNGPTAASPNHQYPSHDSTAPEGIDTNRFYMASDGNWYAYPTEPTALGASTSNSISPHPTDPPLQPKLQPSPSSIPLREPKPAENLAAYTRPEINPAWPAYPPHSSPSAHNRVASLPLPGQ